MALSVKNPITVKDLRGVKDFYDGPVGIGSKAGKIFLLTGANDSKLVIKDDAIFDNQIQPSRFAMKAVHKTSGRVQLLQAGEVLQLKEFIRLYFSLRQDYKAFGMKYRSDMKESIRKLKAALDTGRSQFQKIEFQNVKDAQGVLAKRLAGDKTELQNFTASLVNPGGLESLGEIITVDLVNGNTDRFFPRDWDPAGADGDMNKTIGGQVFRFKALVNPGNVFMSVGPGGRASGLDYLDPQSSYKNMAMRLTDHESGYDYKWPARILADRRARMKYAEDIIHDLELILNPHKSRFSTRTKLGKGRKARVVNGMVSGAQKIAQRMMAKHGPGMSAELKDRYDILFAVR